MTSRPGQFPCRAAQYTGKVDEDFVNWWRASLSYLRYYSLEPGNTGFPLVSTPIGWRLLRRVDTTQFNNLFTSIPTTVLDRPLWIQPLPELQLRR